MKNCSPLQLPVPLSLLVIVSLIAKKILKGRLFGCCSQVPSRYTFVQDLSIAIASARQITLIKGHDRKFGYDLSHR
jgi:hypothetical protein